MFRRCAFLLPLAAVLAAHAPKTSPRGMAGVEPVFMRRSEDPCKDFYAFACGAYDKVPIPAEYAAYGVNEEINERTEAILKRIAEQAAKAHAPKGSLTQRIGDFYASGLDAKAIEAAGAKPLAPMLAEIARVKDARGLAEQLAWLHAHGLGAGFGFGVGLDDKESAREIAQLSQDGLGLPERDYYFRDDAGSQEIRAKYQAHIERMMRLLGEAPAQAKADAEATMALETKLAAASRTLVDLRDPQTNYHKLDRGQIEAAAPAFDWKAYFAGLGLPDAEQRLLVRQPEFFQAFSGLVASVPMESWRAYLRWHLVRGTAYGLSRAFVDEAFAFDGKVLEGEGQLPARWKRVLHAEDRALGFDLGQLFVKEAFSPEAKARVTEMVDFHKEAMRRSIQQADWMSEATKQQAYRKLDAMKAKVGYPDVWRDYSKLAISRRGYLGNLLAAAAFEFQRNVAKLGKPVDRTEWDMTPQTNNAYYEPTRNEIVLPAGILQPPFFSPQADDAVNYGALASTIGHELTHGFDDQGRQYDAQGNLKDWWTVEDAKAYEARAARIVAQYDGFEPVPGFHISGRQTLGENIADVGGLKIAYVAYKLASAGKELKNVDGLTPDQRFFVAFAQGWRTNQRPESLRLLITSDVHSPVRWRVIGPVADQPAFYAAFGCRTPADLPLVW